MEVIRDRELSLADSRVFQKLSSPGQEIASEEFGCLTEHVKEICRGRVHRVNMQDVSDKLVVGSGLSCPRGCPEGSRCLDNIRNILSEDAYYPSKISPSNVGLLVRSMFRRAWKNATTSGGQHDDRRLCQFINGSKGNRTPIRIPL